MNKKNNKVVTFIIGILTIALILLILIIFFFFYRGKVNKDVNNNNNVNSNESFNYVNDANFIQELEIWEKEESEQVKEKKMVEMTDNYTYLLLNQCLNKYFLSSKNAFELIDIEVKKELNITEANLGDFYKENTSFCIDKIYKEELQNGKVIYVVSLRITNNNNTQDSLIMIKQDIKKVTFSIYPFEILKKWNYLNVSENSIININNLEDMQENEFNHYSVDKISTQAPAIISELLKRLQFDIKFDLNHLYNSLDENYKKLRFEDNTEKFLQYVNEYRNIILNDEITSYQTYNANEYTQYYGLAKSNNHYIFNINNIMDYTILLDNYTVDLPQTKEAYEKGSAKAKSEYCLKKVISAINNKDYNLIYDKLSLTQKNQYSSEEFANYLKRAFYEKNDYEIEDYMILNKENAYQFLIKITDSTKKEASFRRYNIRILLQEDMEYVVNITQYKN